MAIIEHRLLIVKGEKRTGIRKMSGSKLYCAQTTGVENS